MVPGFLRASPRTNCAARPIASAAMPHHSDAHSMCEYGTMVCADESAKLPGMICVAAPAPENFAPGLHVPRMPSVSHVPVCSSVYWPRSNSTST